MSNTIKKWGMMSDLAGVQLGQYEVIEEIGRGGMATVYSARQTSVNRSVAIKVLPAQLTHDTNFLERFYREAEIVSSLQHPHVLPVYDFGEYEGLPYLVMAYLPGGTLEDLLEGDPMQLAEVQRIINQVASALDYSHSKGVVHRDLKPSNVLVDEQGNAYLSDFGLAQMSGTAGQLTKSGVIGTPDYMAPEQADAGEITEAADVYALGVTLYQMLAGHVPYTAPTPIGVMLAHVTKPIPNILHERPDLPDSVQEVVDSALAKSPGSRYATPGELAGALAVAFEGAHPSREVRVRNYKALLFTDLGTNVQFADEQFLRMMQMTPGDLGTVIDRPLGEVLGVSKRDIEEFLGEVQGLGQVDAQLQILTSGGTLVQVSVTGVAAYDTEENMIGIDVAFTYSGDAGSVRNEQSVSIDQALNASGAALMRTYFGAQVHSLHRALMKAGGARLGDNLQLVINQTARRYGWALRMEDGKLVEKDDLVPVEIYNALAAKAMLYMGAALGALGSSGQPTLHIEGADEPIALPPETQIIIGRSDPDGIDEPHIDLGPYGAMEKGISRAHALMERQDGQLVLYDMGSHNGTFLNGEKILPAHGPQQLYDGDEIRLGVLTMRIYLH